VSDEPTLRVAALFSARTDLVVALHRLPDVDPCITLVAAATDRPHNGRSTPPGLPVRDFPTASYRDRVERDIAIAEWFSSNEAGLVVTAGWLWLLSPQFLERYPNRVVNVHPTLLPAFPGRHSVEAAVASGVRVHGVTVHLVDAGIDTGPILAQAARSFPDPTTADAVRAALAPIEREQLTGVVRAFAHGRVDCDAETHRWKIADPQHDLGR
jgi:phosphoribosylglycinamide formyltransferase 1